VARVGGEATSKRFLIQDARVHVVTMVLSDGFSDLRTESAKPKEGKDLDSVSWTIDSSASPACAAIAAGIP